VRGLLGLRDPAGGRTAQGEPSQIPRRLVVTSDHMIIDRSCVNRRLRASTATLHRTASDGAAQEQAASRTYTTKNGTTTTMKTGNIGKKKKKAPPGAIWRGRAIAPSDQWGYGATKPLHIASCHWDHDGSEKGALWTGNAPPSDRVAHAAESTQPRDRADVDGVALGDLGQGLARGAALERLLTLIVRQLRLAAELDALRHGAFTTITGALLDQLAFEFRDRGQKRLEQPSPR
jgi:hypothetical protein